MSARNLHRRWTYFRDERPHRRHGRRRRPQPGVQARGAPARAEREVTSACRLPPHRRPRQRRADRALPRRVPRPPDAADRGGRIALFLDAFRDRTCESEVVTLFGMPEGPAERVAAADVVYVNGGNTANALAIWRVHGVDEALREVWRKGGVLGGWSAGGICWFEDALTDSF